jgi:hypothetical protein
VVHDALAALSSVAPSDRVDSALLLFARVGGK